MLEAITDFWKPVKKTAQSPKLSLSDLQIGSVIGFGYVPQVALNGRKLTVTAINSYQFGQDVLTSFVLSNEKDTDISLIVAEAQGEQYLAISRRISVNDRNRLFDADALKSIINNEEVTTFKCRDNVPELKGWLVGGYKREIQGMRGFIHRADFRNGNDGSHAGEEFKYTLLGSNSNEHAIEIESYNDGRIDIYATIYRRTSDISEIEYTNKPQPTIETQKVEPQKDANIEAKEEEKKPTIAEITSSPAPEMKAEIIPEKTLPKEKFGVKEEKSIIKEEKHEPPKQEAAKAKAVKLDVIPLPHLVATPLEAEIEKPEMTKTETIKNNEEKKDMSMATASETKLSGTNGAAGMDLPPVPSFGSAIKDSKQEMKTVTKANGMDNEAVECDLRVANHIIDEAIRNEMRLSDVVRRIIELPVSHQEAVHIPINLADEDYSLLAIRYGIPSSDRNAIKLRIIQDLSDFSGSKKKNS